MPPDAKVLDAIWSVYYHSSFRAGFGPRLIRKGYQPVPVPEAVRILSELRTEHSAARLRKALARLVAAGWAQPERVAKLTGDDGLAKETPQALLEAAQVIGIDPSLITRQDPDEAAREIASAPLMGIACNPTPLSCVACMDGMTLRTTVRGSVRVDRPLAELESSLDPQCWDDCTESLFVDTYKTIQQNNVWVRDPSPPSCGVGWNGQLIEDVLIGPAAFDNRLKIDFWRSPSGKAIRWDFDLRDNRDTRLFGSSQGGILTRDVGHLAATEELSGTSTLIEVEKTVAFDNETLSLMAPAVMCMWADNVGEVLPCC